MKSQEASQDHIWVIFHHKSKFKLINYYTYVNYDIQQNKDFNINWIFQSRFSVIINIIFMKIMNLSTRCKNNYTYIFIFLIIKYLCLGEYLLYCLWFLLNKT